MVALLFSLSCSPKAGNPAVVSFFSLKDYFQEEAQRLTAKNVSIMKQVKRNTSSESKEIRIEDWEKEFSLFIESDINKISWKNSYDSSISQDSTIYLANDSTLRTRKIVIIKNGDRVKEITIQNVVKNYLYSTQENLTYFPDSLYLINKHQNVWLIGENDYLISGRF